MRFIDPSFACEITLSDVNAALYKAVEKEFERLKEIRNLGIIAHISHTAVYTRYQHLIGLLGIFEKLSRQPKGYGLPKDLLWSFWCRLCFNQVGHACFSYDAEKAVLLSCQFDRNFRSRLYKLMNPLSEKLSECTICKKECDQKNGNDDVLIKWFDKMVDENAWYRLHHWIAALKLMHSSKVTKILSDQKKAYSEPETFKMFLYQNCKWDKPISRLNRMDFIVRDLAVTGTANIHLDVDGLISTADKGRHDWSLLKALEKYLENRLYASVENQTTSMLFHRLLADHLIKDRISIQSVFGLNETATMNDNELKSYLCRYSAGREIFDENLRQSWVTRTIRTALPEHKLPYEIEQDLTGQRKGHLTAHMRTRIACQKMHQNNIIGVSICYRDGNVRPNAKSVIKTFRSILKKQHPQLDSRELTVAVFEFLFGKKIDQNLEHIIRRCSELDCGEDILKRVSKVLETRGLRKMDIPAEISLRIGEKDYQLAKYLSNIPLMLMVASLTNRNEINEILQMDKVQATSIIWKEILECQSLYFSFKIPNAMINLIDESQRILHGQIFHNRESASRDLEVFSFLESLKYPSEKVSFKISLPNLKIFNSYGKVENEYDVISLSLGDGKNVELWIWGVTTVKDIAKKREEDLKKINKLKNIIHARWKDEIRVVINYVAKDKNSIIYDIDGTQKEYTP